MKTWQNFVTKEDLNMYISFHVLLKLMATSPALASTLRENYNMNSWTKVYVVTSRKRTCKKVMFSQATACPWGAHRGRARMEVGTSHASHGIDRVPLSHPVIRLGHLHFFPHPVPLNIRPRHLPLLIPQHQTWAPTRPLPTSDLGTYPTSPSLTSDLGT